MKHGILFAALAATMFACGCNTLPRAGRPEPRQGDEIVAAGRFFHTGTRVVLWLDPGGYDAYRVERRFAPLENSDWQSSQAEVKTLTRPNRFGLRRASLTTNEIERVRGGGWDLPLLRRVVDQFVLHFDVAGTSRRCFQVLHDDRGLSVHFLLDLDGTIYQTLDLKECAWHATTSNDRSVGVEIANIGAYPADGPNPFAEWYRTNATGQTVITIPDRLGGGGIRTANFTGHPARNEPVRGAIQGARSGAIRFHAGTIRGAGQIDGVVVPDFSESEMPVSGGRGRKIDHAQTAGRRTEELSGCARPLSCPDGQSGSGPGV